MEVFPPMLEGFFYTALKTENISWFQRFDKVLLFVSIFVDFYVQNLFRVVRYIDYIIEYYKIRQKRS